MLPAGQYYPSGTQLWKQGPVAQQLTRDEIVAAFREMGEILARAGKVAEIAIFGGAAIQLQFEVSFGTGDVDARVETGDHGTLMRAAQDVAARRGWLRSWFSEAVTSYLGDVVSTDFHASYPSETRVGLRVYVAKPDYLLAMKLRAMRIGSRDEADAALLARAAGLLRFEDMATLLARFFPKVLSEGAARRPTPRHHPPVLGDPACGPTR